jgi:hypothetical protein
MELLLVYLAIQAPLSTTEYVGGRKWSGLHCRPVTFALRSLLWLHVRLCSSVVFYRRYTALGGMCCRSRFSAVRNVGGMLRDSWVERTIEIVPLH